MQLEKAYVYDYETVVNCFLGVFVSVKNPKNIISFEISEFKDDTESFVLFLKKCIKQNVLLVSFNGLKFDNQISRAILSSKVDKSQSGAGIAKQIYAIAQEVISISNNKDPFKKTYPLFGKKDNPFKECDILAINNYDNAAKMSSLKWLQYNMDWHNVEDMSTPHNKKHNEKEILVLKSYCINDCLSTRELFFKNKSEIILRSKLSSHFELDLYNSSEPSLAKEIFLKLLSEALGISKGDLRKQRTYRKQIILDELILPYLKFKTPVMINTLRKFKSLKLDGENLKGSFKHEIVYKGLPVSFALGGIHGAKKGVYHSDKDFVIKSFDVTSFYPNLAIRNKWSPAHIPNKIFCEIYEWMFEERKKYDKKNPLNYMYKICLNSTYGLSNEENSFLKDSAFTMKITCNGQLSLMMLMEDLCESIPGSRPIMINTDGGEVIIPREYEQLFDDICNEWQKLTKLELEFEEYESLYIGDVNNYIGIFKSKEVKSEEAYAELMQEFPKPLIKEIDGKKYHYKTKCKGRFEIDKPLHKNKSYRIHRIALYNYFVLGIKPEDTLKECKNIMDYCAGVRAKGNWKFVSTCLEDGSILDNNLPKTIRYYRSNRGCKIRKLKQDSEYDVKSIKLEADKVLENILNKHNKLIPFDSYNVDMGFHLRKINSEIQNIQPFVTQQSLF